VGGTHKISGSALDTPFIVNSAITLQDNISKFIGWNELQYQAATSRTFIPSALFCLISLPTDPIVILTLHPDASAAAL